MPLSHDDIPINLDTEALTDSGFFHATDVMPQMDIDVEERHARKPAAPGQSRELDLLNDTVSKIPSDITVQSDQVT